MKPPTRNNGGRFRKTIATGLVPLLFLSLLSAYVARHMPDWSRVQVVHSPRAGSQSKRLQRWRGRIP